MSKKYVTVNVDVKAHKRLKTYCTKSGKIMSNQLTEAINTHVDKAESVSK